MKSDCDRIQTWTFLLLLKHFIVIISDKIRVMLSRETTASGALYNEV